MSARKLTDDVSVVDDPRVPKRTLAIAIRKFGPRVFFQHALQRGRGRETAETVGGATSGRSSTSFNGAEVKGAGMTPHKAFEDAVERAWSERDRWQRIRS